MAGPSRRAFLLALPGLLTAPGFAAARAAAPGFGGIYATPAPLFDARRLLPDAAHESRAASGIYIRLIWSQIAPRPGQYDFSLLDRELERAVAAGKRVSLSVIAGGYAPAWLRERGVRTLRFDIGRGGANRACMTVEMGVPWDPGYQAAFLESFTALARHIRARPGGWEALRIVKLTGINRLTEELRLPALTERQQDVCGAQDETGRWAAAGFRPSLVVEAWSRIAQGIAERFPGKQLALDILERNDFPPIGEDGARVAESPVKPRILAEGQRRFGPRFAVQWNGLTAAGPLSETVLAAGRRGVVTGWQSNAFRGVEGAGCNTARRAAPEACDLGGFQAILQRGVATGAAYIEAWAPDVLRFPEAVAAADRALAARGR
jgi:hypothetical protein